MRGSADARQRRRAAAAVPLPIGDHYRRLDQADPSNPKQRGEPLGQLACAVVLATSGLGPESTPTVPRVLGTNGRCSVVRPSGVGPASSKTPRVPDAAASSRRRPPERSAAAVPPRQSSSTRQGVGRGSACLHGSHTRLRVNTAPSMGGGFGREPLWSGGSPVIAHRANGGSAGIRDPASTDRCRQPEGSAERSLRRLHG